MADDSMYDDGGDEGSPAPKSEKKETESNTALLPKSFFPGDKSLEPGNTCTIRVERVLDDQVEVTYSHKKADDDEPEEIVEETDKVSEMMD